MTFHFERKSGGSGTGAISPEPRHCFVIRRTGVIKLQAAAQAVPTNSAWGFRANWGFLTPRHRPCVANFTLHLKWGFRMVRLVVGRFRRHGQEKIAG